MIKTKALLTDMQDSDTVVSRRLQRLEQQIRDMLLSPTTDHRYIIRELEDTYDLGSSTDQIAVIEILCKIKDTNQNLNDNEKKKLQKVLNHYCERC